MRVLNKRRLKSMDFRTMIYIGRRELFYNEHFGNPFSHIKYSQASYYVSTRDEAVDAHWEWLIGNKYQDVEPERRQWILNHLDMLDGMDLVCWCHPLRCHGENYIRLLEEIRSGRLSIRNLLHG